MEKLTAPPPASRPAERHALAGAALARLFEDAGFVLGEASTARRERWRVLLDEEGHDDGRAWMAAAEWVDALKRDDAAAARAAADRARPLLARLPARTPLHWLAEHPDAGFAQAREELELAPPRAAWLGVLRIFFRSMDPEELARATAPAFDRLAQLQQRGGFPVVLLTYLDCEKSVPSDRLRAFAGKRGFPLADLQALHPAAELLSDGKRRYFVVDRSHPNEAGYRLMANAALPLVRAALATR